MLNWWRRIREERASRVEVLDQHLPFSPEELAQLIQSGRRDDFKRLAAGFGGPRKARRPF